MGDFIPPYCENIHYFLFVKSWCTETCYDFYKLGIRYDYIKLSKHIARFIARFFRGIYQNINIETKIN